VQHLASVIRRGSVQEQQGAFEVLGSLKSREARDLLASFLDELIARRIAPEIQLDVLDAVQATGSPALQTKLDAHLKARSADSLVAAFREGLLRGGDERRGRQVFAENAAAGCPRCHAVRGRGPDVGPDLSTIGKTLSRDELLQALVEPNARVAPGYGTVAVTLRSGQRIDGTLRQETETHLVLLAGTPPAEQRIAKADISQRTDPVSAMPPVALILKPREIRDLVEFLSTLK
jgi:quinoprotein glucose dehydrogenase